MPLVLLKYFPLMKGRVFLNTKTSRLSQVVRDLGYTESPLPLEEWLRLLETIQSSLEEKGTSQRLNLPPVILSCDFCKKEYVKPSYVVQKSIRRGHRDNYCSLDCSQSHHAVKNCHRCKVCGIPVEKKGRKYCAGCRPKPVGKKAEHPPIKAKCPTCNTEFMAANRCGGRYAVYCTKRCSEIGHSIRMSGKGNPHWIHGLALAREQPYCAKAFREMRRLVLARDQHSCVFCGETNKKLHVHHLDGNPTNNAAANLVTLCALHHKRIHAAMDFGRDMTMWNPLFEYVKKPLFTISKSKPITTSLQMDCFATTAF